MSRNTLLFVIFFSMSLAGSSVAQPAVDGSEVERFLVKLRNESLVPGIAAATIGPEGRKRFFLGYSDRRRQVPPDETTSFELGSNSKAFTALAAMLLAGEGRLDLDAPVRKYLPWLTFHHAGRPVEPRVRDFLFHTSGIPFRTLDNIRQAAPGNELESTVRSLIGEATLFPPGRQFSYATLNYDVVGLLIEVVSGRSYHDFLREEVLGPLGLTHTSMPGDRLVSSAKSIGHKLGFGRAHPFAAPVRRGHTPAAYISSTLEDMERWAGIVLGTVPAGAALSQAIAQTLQPNRSVPPEPVYRSLYAGGWYRVEHPQLELSHPGSNPNFSSCIALYPEQGRAVIILANLNSTVVLDACSAVNELSNGRRVGETFDLYRSVDLYSSVLLVVSSLGCAILLLVLGRSLLRARRSRARIESGRLLEWRPLLFLVGALSVVTAGLYSLPWLLFQGLAWPSVLEWGPTTLLPALAACWSFFALLTLRRFLRYGLPATT
jgi:CubicO group peptidase (beta-lactamase class C family)